MVTFTVTNTNDNGAGSLRQAIADANANGNDGTQDVITFDIPDDATIILTSGELAITEDLFIDGDGQTIDADRNSRVIFVNEDGTVAIDELSVIGGDAESGAGGGIYNQGDLALYRSVLSDNEADAGGAIAITESGLATILETSINGNFAFDGGGIQNEGSIYLIDSSLSGNLAPTAGGGIANSGDATFQNVLVTGNDAPASDGGGAHNTGLMTINESIFSNNGSEYSGGAISNSGTVDIANSSLYENDARFDGGAIDNSGYLSIYQSSLLNNDTFYSGGAIDNGGDLQIDQSIVSLNFAAMTGGGLNNTSTALISNSLIAENYGYQGGGTRNFGDLISVNSTFYSNGAYQGGGLYNAGFADVAQSTFSQNEAENGSGIYDVAADGDGVVLSNSVVADGIAGDDIDTASTIELEGVNIVEDGSVTGPDVINADPLLGPLQDNGGPTLTQALLAGSPAIDAGDNSEVPAVLTTDQRGEPRIVDGDGDSTTVVDLGAFEASEGSSPPVGPTTFTVTNTNDSGAGSLRQAVADANANDGLDRIEFAIADDAIIELTGGLLGISDDLEIDGDGQTIDALGNSQIFSIDSDVEASIDELTLTGGYSDYGGAIYNAGDLTVNSSTLLDNFGFYNGGAIDNSGRLTVNNSTLADNISTGSLNFDFYIPAGGAIVNSGHLIITSSSFTDNEAQYGGAVYNSGNLTITDSMFAENVALYSTFGSGDGGAIFNRGTSFISDSSIRDNYAYDRGGAVASDSGYMVLSNVTVEDNNAYLGGGGIANSTSELRITGSTIADNDARFGGGIYNDGYLELTESTLTRNLAEDGAGILNFREAYIANTTFHANTASNRGGGLYDGSYFGGAEVYFSTFSKNAAENGGGIYIEESLGSVRLGNSIIADSIGGGDVDGSLDLVGRNLIEDGSATGPNVINADPLLGPLQDNGGPTETLALLPGSPAIDAGDNSEVPAGLVTDQRGFGFPRIVDGNGNTIATVDVGAFEAGSEVVVLPFPELVERQAVPSDAINGVNPALLVGDGAEIQVEFQLADAELQSSLGFYTYEDDGFIGEVELLDANLGDTPAGTVYSLGEIPKGQPFGLFLAVNGFADSELIRDEGLDLNSSLSLLEQDGIFTAAVGDQERQRLAVEDGFNVEEIEGVPIFHASTFGGALGNPLNLGGEIQALSGLNEDGNLQIAFEDVSRGDAPNLGNSDEDFNDAVIELIRLPSEEFNGSGGYFA